VSWEVLLWALACLGAYRALELLEALALAVVDAD